MSLSEAARAIDATMEGPDAGFTSVSTDTRMIDPGALFVALRGERFDGHAFVEAARAGGAAAAMVEKLSRMPGSEVPLLVVADTRLALGKLAAHWRAKHALPLIGVVGSNGKTTVKEMIAAILRAHFGPDRALATEGNLNNEIGLPLTLLRLRAAHRAAVVEIGMNHPGETAALAAIAGPTIGLVNNAQREHQEFMKSVAEVAREHASLIASLPQGGVAVINADDEFAHLWRETARKTGASVRDFGIEKPAAVGGRYRIAGFASEIVVTAPEGETTLEFSLSGVHNVRNALAAAAAATAAGASLEAVARGLSGFSGLKGRQKRLRGLSGATVIDDSYNANPDSVRAAIDVLAASRGERVLVLGDMGELGAEGPAYHEEIGRYARASGIGRLLALGDLARRAVDAFGQGASHFAAADELARELAGTLSPRLTVLVKGSRFMRMEKVVEKLIDKDA